ncbi:hypothetical protein [Agrococcus sp. Ld7]|uniref:hypothetical protein n=1 Tax=Agrococcus sp. Ld7 TaxID=649148 RepID=UPI00386DD789
MRKRPARPVRQSRPLEQHQSAAWLQGQQERGDSYFSLCFGFDSEPCGVFEPHPEEALADAVMTARGTGADERAHRR